MHILLISVLPGIHDFFGLKHHYPIGVSLPAGGFSCTVLTVSEPGGITTFIEIDPASHGSAGEILRTADVQGPAVAHLSGTSASMLRMADELLSRSVPIVYSPMLPSVPTRIASLAGGVTGVRTAAMKELELAGKIAGAAVRIVVDSPFMETCLRRRAGIPGAKILTVPGPAIPGRGVPGRGVPGNGASAGGTVFGNLAVAFCDAIAPEWNVMRFLFAMEKINADAVIAVGKSDTPYARECVARAALNNRVKFLFWEPGDARSQAGEVAAVMGRASVFVDPSIRGLGGAIVTAVAGAGMPSVISRKSVYASPAPDGIFPFEPTSWELLHYAITGAFNRAASGPAERGAVQAEDRNGETARILRQVYIQAARV